MAATNDNELGVKVKIEPSAVGFKKKLDEIGKSHKIELEIGDKIDEQLKTVRDKLKEISETKFSINTDDIKTKLDELNSDYFNMFQRKYELTITTEDAKNELNTLEGRLSRISRSVKNTNDSLKNSIDTLFGENAQNTNAAEKDKKVETIQNSIAQKMISILSYQRLITEEKGKTLNVETDIVKKTGENLSDIRKLASETRAANTEIGNSSRIDETYVNQVREQSEKIKNVIDGLQEYLTNVESNRKVSVISKQRLDNSVDAMKGYVQEVDSLTNKMPEYSSRMEGFNTALKEQSADMKSAADDAARYAESLDTITMAGEGKYGVQLVSSGKELGTIESNFAKLKGDSSDLRLEVDALQKSLKNLMQDPNRSSDDVIAYLSNVAKVSQDVSNRLEQQKKQQRDNEAVVRRANKSIENILVKMKTLGDDEQDKYQDVADGFKKRMESLPDDPMQAAQETADIYKEISDVLSEIVVKIKQQAEEQKKVKSIETGAKRQGINLNSYETKSATKYTEASNNGTLSKTAVQRYGELTVAIREAKKAQDEFNKNKSAENLQALEIAVGNVRAQYELFNESIISINRNSTVEQNSVKSFIKSLNAGISTLSTAIRGTDKSTIPYSQINNDIQILVALRDNLVGALNGGLPLDMPTIINDVNDALNKLTQKASGTQLSVENLSDAAVVLAERLANAKTVAGDTKNYEKQQHAAKVLQNQYVNLANQILALYDANKNLAGTSIGNQFLDLAEKAKQGKVDITNLRTEYAKLITAAREQNLIGESAIDKILKVFTGRVSNVLSGYAITAILQGLRGMLQNVVEIDTAMTELKKVTDETSVAYNKFLDGAADRAKKLGVSISEIVNVTADWARLGNTMKDAQNLADYTILLKNVGDGIEDVNTASEYLISTLNGFQMDNSQIQNIVDVINQVANTEPVSANDIGAILQRSSAAMSAANNTFEETVALGTAMNSVVQNAEVTGTALRSLSMYLRAAKTEAEDAGIETEGMAESTSELRDELLKLTGVDIQTANGDFKSTYQIMKELAGVWQDLSDVTQANVLEMIAGKRNSQAASALLANYNIVEDTLRQTQNAAGSAAAENEKYLQSIEGKVAQFTAAFEALSQTVIDSGLIKGFVDFGTALLNAVNGVVKLTGSLPALTTLLTGIVGVVNTISVSKGGKIEVPTYACCDLKVA